jgi:hypothetical protein
MLPSLSNQKGFALALMLGLLPILLGALFATSAAIGLMQSDLKFKHICRSEGLIAQEKVGRLLQVLMSLNSRALQLRIQLQAARASLAVAMAAHNPVAIAKFTKQIAQIKKAQLSLDIRQKNLINESNRELKMNHNRADRRLKTIASQTLNGFPGLQIGFQTRWVKPPRLAVEPDMPGIAPVYRTHARFEQEQTLAHRWHYQVEIRPPLNSFL